MTRKNHSSRSSQTAQHGKVFRLHADAKGYIWLTDGEQQPASSGMKAKEFVSSSPFCAADSVKVLGVWQNIDLILRLYDRKLAKTLSNVFVGSPVIDNSYDKLNQPDVILSGPDILDGHPASVGGWHKFDDLDFPTYYMARLLNSNNISSQTMQLVLDVFKTHVVWPSMLFIPHLDMEKCVLLVASLLDPRWYVDLTEPDRNSKMEGFLGLIPSIQSKVSSCQQLGGKTVQLCRLVMETWRRGKPTTKEEFNEPGNFLWRVYESEGGGEKGDLRASQMFVTYLKCTWTQGLYQNKLSVSSDGLFVPEHFFSNKSESDSYKLHLMRLQKGTEEEETSTSV